MQAAAVAGHTPATVAPATPHTAHTFDAARLWRALQGTTSVPLMVAAAALRSVQRLPDDPRLNPLPYPKAGVAHPKTAEERARSGSRPQGVASPRPGVALVADEAVLVRVADNPKKPGSASHTRYAVYAVGLTVRELLAAGLTRADIRWDLQREYVEFAAE